MSWDTVSGKNSEGYRDPTAATALSNVQRSQRTPTATGSNMEG